MTRCCGLAHGTVDIPHPRFKLRETAKKLSRTQATASKQARPMFTCLHASARAEGGIVLYRYRSGADSLQSGSMGAVLYKCRSGADSLQSGSMRCRRSTRHVLRSWTASWARSGTKRRRSAPSPPPYYHACQHSFALDSFVDVRVFDKNKKSKNKTEFMMRQSSYNK